MTPRHDRRAFLRGAAATAAALPFATLFSRRAIASPFGGLRPDPAKILDLPEGFSYRVLSRSLQPMDDGFRVPGRPDGMGCFPGPGNTLILMRNHECFPKQRDLAPWGPGQAPPPEAYDPRMNGGVTRVVVREGSFERVSSNLVLAGTSSNCAGGWSPWGWLSCEETVDAGHGYVFVCRPDADRVQPPHRVPGYGRFYHEAAVVDPETMIAYLTEDRADGAFYRFVPDRKEAPFAGRLQAMRAVGRERLAIASALRPGETVEVDWVDIADPDPREDSLRGQAQARGAALIRRGEGITRHEGSVYVCSSTGGPVFGGQILRYTPARSGDRGTLTVVAESTSREALDMPDNLAFAPWGELFMVEDGLRDNFIMAMNERGEAYPFARNALSESEMAGVCFSPDGRALFVNLQEDGLTLVVTGPFPGTPGAARGAAPAPGSGSGSGSASVEWPASLPAGTIDAPISLPSGHAGAIAGCSGGSVTGSAAVTGGVITGAGALAWLLRKVCSRG